jgi:hypothetical protein
LSQLSRIRFVYDSGDLKGETIVVNAKNAFYSPLLLPNLCTDYPKIGRAKFAALTKCSLRFGSFDDFERLFDELTMFAAVLSLIVHVLDQAEANGLGTARSNGR